MRMGRVILLVLLLPGCSEILGARDYRVTQSDERPTGPIYAPACWSCLERECLVELDQCDGDPACEALLTCVAGCSDPGCMFRCAAPDFGPLRRWPIEEIEDCLVGSCRDDCPVGEAMACDPAVARWPAVYDGDEADELSVRAFDAIQGIGSVVTNAEVRLCSRNVAQPDECVDAVPPERVDAQGDATFAIPLSDTGFEGYLEASVVDDPDVVYRAFRNFPYNDYWELNQLGIDASGTARNVYEQETGRTFDETVGAAFFDLYDCLTWPAHELVMTAPEPSDEVWIYYPAQLIVGPEQQTTWGRGFRRDGNGSLIPAFPFIAIVAPVGTYRYEIRRVDGGPVVFTGSIRLRPATFDNVTLYRGGGDVPSLDQPQ